MYAFDEIKKSDPEIAAAIEGELARQRSHIELIASENFVSKAVMAAMGSPLTNKYAEGYPGKRYYNGCDWVDKAEELAISRAKALFGAQHANVQTHSGAQANMAVFYAFLKPGDTFMGMNLAHGGHLTHGSPVTMSGTHFNVVSYGVEKETGRIDYDQMRKTALASRPKMIVCGASAYPRVIDFKVIREIADEVGALVMADIAHIAGLVATGLHPSSVPYAHISTSTTHKTLRGPRGGLILCSEEYAEAIDKAVFPGIQGGPLMHTIAAKAVAFKEALENDYTTYMTQVVKNAAALANALMAHGFNLVSGGTDNHLVLVDLQNLDDMSGKKAANRLDKIGLTCNRNAVPFDPRSPFITSGIRLGTPAVTSRGMNEADMQTIADIIALVVRDHQPAAAREKLQALTAQYPLY